MAEPQPHDDHEDEIDPTKARLDLLSAYAMHGRLERDGLLTPRPGQTGTGGSFDDCAALSALALSEDDSSPSRSSLPCMVYAERRSNRALVGSISPSWSLSCGCGSAMSSASLNAPIPGMHAR